ncbi:MAG: glycosyltransferase family 2 protein, partial [Flavobacteriaceae bacterium]|nr:glycosyltransferase family 2 protein [Flavobacteriaceae bacterium]
FFKNNPKVGVAIPQQLDHNKQPAYSFDFNHGIRRLIFGIGFVNFFKKEKRKKKLYTTPISVDFIQGCFMFFDKKAFSMVGGFDTNIFLYYEEMDICYRLNKKGFDSYLVPDTKFIHLEGESTQKNFTIKKELNISRLYVLQKNHNYLKYSFIRFFFLMKWLLKSFFNPKCMELVLIIFKGAYSENSMKLDQKICRDLNFKTIPEC